jgi:hypothetical protein
MADRFADAQARRKMADYHPLIARAVGGLEKDTAENRRALYERARTALVTQLRSTVPPLEEAEITRERLALEEAIRRVEVESARRAREAPKSDGQAANRTAEAESAWREREEMTRREEAARHAHEEAQVAEAARREEFARREREEKTRRDEAARQEEAERAARALEAAIPLPTFEPTAKPTTLPEVASPSVVQPRAEPRNVPVARVDEALKEFRDAVRTPADEAARAPKPPVAPKYPTPPTARPPLDSMQELASFEPQMGHEDWRAPPAEQARSLQAYAFDETSAKAGVESGRHYEETPPRSLRSYGRMTRIGVLILIAFVAGAAIYWNADAIGNSVRAMWASIRGSPAQPQQESTPVRQKNPDRVGQPESTQPARTGPTATQRAMLTTEPDAANPAGKDYVGSAAWKLETIAAAPGPAAEVAITLDVQIPDRGFAMTWVIKRNTDPALPATHTIEVEFNIAPDSPLGPISEIRSILMKQPGQPEGSPLWGHAQRSTPNFFLVGLSATAADAQYNLQLLKSQPAFDVALVFTKARRAFLLIEKGPVGERVFAEAFAAWKQ